MKLQYLTTKIIIVARPLSCFTKAMADRRDHNSGIPTPMRHCPQPVLINKNKQEILSISYHCATVSSCKHLEHARKCTCMISNFQCSRSPQHGPKGSNVVQIVELLMHPSHGFLCHNALVSSCSRMPTSQVQATLTSRNNRSA